MKKIIIGIIIILSNLPSYANDSLTMIDSTKIRLTMDYIQITATLINNKSTRDFITLLPLTLTLIDYANTEKISGLPQKLSIEDAPAGYQPSMGDVAYYAPWGNLCIFHKDFSYSSGLVILGKIDSGYEIFKKPGPIQIKIERMK